MVLQGQSYKSYFYIIWETVHDDCRAGGRESRVGEGLMERGRMCSEQKSEASWADRMYAQECAVNERVYIEKERLLRLG